MRLARVALAAAALVATISAASLRAQEAQTAKCPVSNAEVKITDKTPSVGVNGTRLYFCCMNCPKAFAADPEKFVKQAGNCPVNKNGAAKVSKESRVVLNNDLFYACCANCPKALAANTARFVKELRDPVSGKPAPVAENEKKVEHAGRVFYFASEETMAEFKKDPAKYTVAYK